MPLLQLSANPNSLKTMKNLLLLLLLLPAIVFAQTQRADSLKQTLTKNQPDTQRVKTLVKIGWNLLGPYAVEGLKYANQAINISQKIGYKKGLADGYFIRGQMYFNINEQDSTKGDYNTARRLYKQINDIGGLARVYSEIGRMLRIQGKLADAIIYFQQSADMFEKIHDDDGTADCLVLLANNYNLMNNFDKALLTYKKALAIRIKLGDENMVGQTLGGIGMTYRNMAGDDIASKHFKPAIDYMMRSRKIFVKLDHKLNIALITKEIGVTYRYQDKDKPGLYYLLEAEKCFNKIDYKRELGALYKNIGICYQNLKQYPQARQYFEKCLASSVEENYQVNIVEAYQSLYEYYKVTGDDKLALKYHEKWMNEQDSLTKRSNFDRLSELTTKFETEKKEQQINLLSKENTIQKLSISKQQTTIGITVGILIAALLFGGLLYNRNKHKQKILAQQQMLRQQETMTQAIIDAEEKERKRIASDLHDGVGQMFSAVKMNLNGLIDRISFNREEDRFLAEKTLALVDESCKEVRVISHQMMPNMLLRSGIASDVKSFIEKIDSERLKVNVEATGFKNKLESNVEIVLYRVIQETVNNVIKHAQATALDIILTREDSGITAVVADNGIGFNTDLKDDFAGIGLKNIVARIEYLKGTVEYKSAPNKGTSVNIWVPIS
jgi:two-component system NarL family sensor kinase